MYREEREKGVDADADARPGIWKSPPAFETTLGSKPCPRSDLR